MNLQLDSNVTFITGDSGTGKTAVYSFLEEYSSEDKRVRCLNYLDHNKGYKTSIRKSKGKVFIIDNADILLDDNLRQHIVMDAENQYVIIGRNPTCLLLSQDDIRELVSTKTGEITTFTLERAFRNCFSKLPHVTLEHEGKNKAGSIQGPK